MKVLIYLVACFVVISGYGQTNNGTGNNQFKLALQNVQNCLVKQTEIRQLEKTLGKYTRYEKDSVRYVNGNYRVVAEYVNLTDSTTVSDFHVQYDSTRKVNLISYTLSKDKMIRLLKDLGNAGYIDDDNSVTSQMMHKITLNYFSTTYYRHKTKKVYVQISVIDPDSYKCTFSK